MDSAALVKRRDCRDATGKPLTVPAKVKAAVEIMLTLADAPDLAKIAEQVGYRDAYELRKHLMKPQSVHHLRDRKRQVLESINAANPEALRKVRDESGNSMAKVQAVRTLEAMGDRMDDVAGVRSNLPAPGVVIIIEQAGRPDRIIGPTAPPVIDAQPDEFGVVD